MTQEKKKKSSPTTKSGSGSKSSLNNVVRSETEIAGHKVALSYIVHGKRAEVRLLKEDDVLKMPEENIIKVEDIPGPPFPKPEPEAPVELVPEMNGDEAAAAEQRNAAHVKWMEEKAEWEKTHPAPADLKKVALWAPVMEVVNATMDGMKLKVFHTLRGPIMGAIRGEDTHKAALYSPCLMDPNIEKGRVHYLPIAFAGFEMNIYKSTCIGEGVPQLAEISGYPEFIEANKRGNYQFRMRAAYHHVEADMPEDAPVLSASLDVRAHVEGLLPTTDTREQQAINKARMAKQMITQKAAETPQPPTAS